MVAAVGCVPGVAQCRHQRASGRRAASGVAAARRGLQARPVRVRPPRAEAWAPVKAQASQAAAAEAQVPEDCQQDGLIFGTGGSGAWDDVAVGSPVVRNWVIDGEQRWVMWYSGATSDSPTVGPAAPVSGSIGVAVSSDGVNWSRGSGSISGGREQETRDADVGRIMEPNEDWWWMDTCHLGASDVQVFSDGNTGSGVFWMFYQGADFEAVPVPAGLAGPAGAQREMEGLRLRPALAMSQDGKNWARIEGDHHSGALFDVGEEGEWDSLLVAHPQVLSVRPKEMRMYYHSYDASDGVWKVGLAVSEHGFSWTKKGVIFEGGQGDGAFDAKGAAARHVVRNRSGDYLMFYEAVAADDTRSIGLAVSKNGIDNWKRCDAPVLAPSGAPGAWDEAGVGAPRAVPMADSWRLYYSGRSAASASWDGIGLALSEEEAPKLGGVATRFQRRQAR